ncbi:MAG: aldo/keto reductase, partial [Eggerthellaceae bacterium]|nr:aldo/keto reductase [Eggerthellaceae bacterium]
TNPIYQQNVAKKCMEKYGIQIEAWAPFAEGHDDLFHNPILSVIADKHHKTVAQIILRWDIQRNTVVIPKTVHKQYMQENFEVFDFELDDDDMQAIARLDSGKSTFISHTDPEGVEHFMELARNPRLEYDAAFGDKK